MSECKILSNDYDSILDGLENERIFSIKRDAKGFIFKEECDGYFKTVLSPVQLLKLIDELGILAKERSLDTTQGDKQDVAI